MNQIVRKKMSLDIEMGLEYTYATIICGDTRLTFDFEMLLKDEVESLLTTLQQRNDEATVCFSSIDESTDDCIIEENCYLHVDFETHLGHIEIIIDHNFGQILSKTQFDLNDTSIQKLQTLFEAICPHAYVEESDNEYNSDNN